MNTAELLEKLSLKEDTMLGHVIYYQLINRVISTFKEIVLKLSLMRNGI